MVFGHPGTVSNQQLYEAFVAAFSDYNAPLGLRPEDFNVRIYQKLRMSDPHSVIALEGDDPVGFIFHTKNSYENVPTIYNGGTGVIPGFRKKGIATKMYEWIFPQLAESGARRIVLEVIRQNTKAIALYESLGFTFKKTLHCFKLHDTVKDTEKFSFVYTESLPAKVDSHICYSPSFIDSDQQLQNNLANEKIIMAKDMAGAYQGHIIFQPHNGRISRVTFATEQAGRALVQQAQLLSTKKELTILNIPEDAYPMLDALSAIGFKNEIDQYEMELYF